MSATSAAEQSLIDALKKVFNDHGLFVHEVATYVQPTRGVFAVALVGSDRVDNGVSLPDTGLSLQMPGSFGRR